MAYSSKVNVYFLDLGRHVHLRFLRVILLIFIHKQNRYKKGWVYLLGHNSLQNPPNFLKACDAPDSCHAWSKRSSEMLREMTFSLYVYHELFVPRCSSRYDLHFMRQLR